MQRNHLLDVLKQKLPLPLYEEIRPELSFEDKVHSAMSPYNVAGLTDVCDTNNEMLQLILNDHPDIKALPAYTVAYLVYKYRQSTDFLNLQTRMMTANIPMTKIEWRIYTYVASAYELRSLPVERVEELAQHFLTPNFGNFMEFNFNIGLQYDLRIAYAHIMLLNGNENWRLPDFTLGAIHDLRILDQDRRYNLCGINIDCVIANTQLTYVDFSGATLRTHSLFGADLSYCNFQNARLLAKSGDGAKLKGVNFCNTDFSQIVINNLRGKKKPGITIFGLQYVTGPLDLDQLTNCLNQFYNQYSTRRLHELLVIRDAIAFELVEAVTNNQAMRDNEKYAMLNIFSNHPLFGDNKLLSNHFTDEARMFGRLFGNPDATASKGKLAIRLAMTELEQQLRPANSNQYF